MPVAGLVFSVLAGCKQSEHHAADVWATVNDSAVQQVVDNAENRSEERRAGKECRIGGRFRW